MNIYALPGHKVIFKDPDTYSGCHESVLKNIETLKNNKYYSVLETVVTSSVSYVRLKEHPDKRINTIFFEDALPQSPEDDMKHPDWLRIYFRRNLISRFNSNHLHKVVSIFKIEYDDLLALISSWYLKVDYRDDRLSLEDFIDVAKNIPGAETAKFKKFISVCKDID